MWAVLQAAIYCHGVPAPRDPTFIILLAPRSNCTTNAPAGNRVPLAMHQSPTNHYCELEHKDAWQLMQGTANQQPDHWSVVPTQANKRTLYLHHHANLRHCTKRVVIMANYSRLRIHGILAWHLVPQPHKCQLAIDVGPAYGSSTGCNTAPGNRVEEQGRPVLQQQSNGLTRVCSGRAQVTGYTCLRILECLHILRDWATASYIDSTRTLLPHPPLVLPPSQHSGCHLLQSQHAP
jgi:hypothetical protein